LEVEAGTGLSAFSRAQAQVGGIPGRDLLSISRHYLRQLWVTRFAQLIAHGDEAGQRCLDSLEGIAKNSDRLDLPLRDRDAFRDRDRCQSEQLGNGKPCHARVPVGRLTAAEDEVYGANLV